MARVRFSKKVHTKLCTIHATYLCTQDTHTQTHEMCGFMCSTCYRRAQGACFCTRLDFWQKQTLLFVLAICLAFAVLRIFHTSRFACMCRMIFACVCCRCLHYTHRPTIAIPSCRVIMFDMARARTRAQVQSLRNASSTGFCCRFCRAIQYKKWRDKHNAYDINTDRCMMYYYSWHMIVCVCVFWAVALSPRWGSLVRRVSFFVWHRPNLGDSGYLVDCWFFREWLGGLRQDGQSSWEQLIRTNWHTCTHFRATNYSGVLLVSMTKKKKKRNPHTLRVFPTT